METRTNELVSDGASFPNEDFTSVPNRLIPQAKRVLGERPSTFVKRDTQDGRDLLSWSKNERNKRKRKKKQQTKSKKKNR